MSANADRNVKNKNAKERMKSKGFVKKKINKHKQHHMWTAES